MNDSIALKVENVNKIYQQGNKHIEALKYFFRDKLEKFLDCLGQMEQANLLSLIYLLAL